MVTWQELQRCPEIAGLKADAQSVAENERTGWYERWLPSSSIFAEATRKAAERLGVDPADVREVARVELLDAYRVAKSRLQRKMQPSKARQPIPRERGGKFVSYADY